MFPHEPGTDRHAMQVQPAQQNGHGNGTGNAKSQSWNSISAVGCVVGAFARNQTFGRALSDERVFRELIPYLILLASTLLAFQPQMRRWVVQRMQQGGAHGDHPALAVPLIFIASIYGGYFGAGLSVIVLAMLGLVLEDTLTRLNGLKQAISFSVNVAAALFFVFSGEVVWSAAAVMAVGALLGGALGGRLAGQIQPNMLRWLVVTIGVIVAVIYLAR